MSRQRFFVFSISVIVLCSVAIACSSSPSAEATERSTALEGPGCVAGDCVNGEGIFIYDDKSKYEGAFKDGKRNGKGVFTYVDGEIFEGIYLDGQRNGAGKYSFSNGDSYIGSFKAGLREGKGVYTFGDGSSYNGAFIADGNDGAGVYIENSKSRECKLKGKAIVCIIKGESRKAIQTPQDDEAQPTRFEGNR